MVKKADMTVSLDLASSLPLPLAVRLRLLASRIVAAVGAGACGRLEAERRFLEISRSQSNLIASICLSFAGDREEFEDLRQDTLLNIWRGIGSFRSQCSISTWVYRVALNTCVSSQRKRKSVDRRQEAFTEFYRELFDTSTMPVAEVLERTMKCRRAHIWWVAFAMPLVIIWAAALAYTMRVDIYMVYGILFGGAVGLVIGIRIMLDFMADYRRAMRK